MDMSGYMPQDFQALQIRGGGPTHRLFWGWKDSHREREGLFPVAVCCCFLHDAPPMPEAPGLKKAGQTRAAGGKGQESSRGPKKKGDGKAPKKKADKIDTVYEDGPAADTPAPATPLGEEAPATSPLAIHIDISSDLQTDLENMTAENAALKAEVQRLTKELEALRAGGQTASPEVS